MKLRKHRWQHYFSIRSTYTFVLFCAVFYLFVIVIAALTASLWLPDKTPDANLQHNELPRLKPGTSVDFFAELGSLESQHVVGIPLADTLPNYGFVADSFWYAPRLGSIVTLAYTESGTNAVQKKPKVELRETYLQQSIHTQTFWLGTDPLGRDVFSRLILGARVSLGVGILGAVLSLVIGLLVGLMAGYLGGGIDQFLTAIMSLIWSLPAVLLTVALSFAFGKGFLPMTLAIALALWVDLARVVRGQVQSLKQREFVLGAKVLGASTNRILLLHITPHLGRILLILSCANFSTAILLEAGLSFLGMGISAPTPSWGGMIFEGYSHLMVPGSRWIALGPGLMLILQLISVNFIVVGLKKSLPKD